VFLKLVLKVKSVLIRTLFRGIRAFPEQINAKQKLFFNSKSGGKVIPSLCLYSKQKSRKATLNKAIKSHRNTATLKQ
jgi:hypothetical protein